jgi:AraC-like DNA-binding protein
MDGRKAPELALSTVARRRDSLVAPGLIGDIRRTIRGARLHVHHSHPDLEINLVVRGSGSYVIHEQVHELRPGTLMWIAPNLPHWLRRGPGLEMWVVQLRPSALEPDWLADVAARPSRMVASHELIDLDRLMSQVALDSDEPAAYNAGITYVLMRALRASRDRPQARWREMHPAVTRALMLMRQRDKVASLSDLAAEAGIAPTYLSRLLMEQTGRNFVDWRNRIRLDRFIEAYRPGVNLLAAALDAGFGSYARFHHVFSELVGCPPSEWMSQVDEGKIVPKAGVAASLPGYGVPSGSLLSARQRWTPLARMVSPSIGRLIGRDFADRVTAAQLRERSPLWQKYDRMDMSLTPTTSSDSSPRSITRIQRPPRTTAEWRRPMTLRRSMSGSGPTTACRLRACLTWSRLSWSCHGWRPSTCSPRSPRSRASVGRWKVRCTPPCRDSTRGWCAKRASPCSAISRSYSAPTLSVAPAATRASSRNSTSWRGNGARRCSAAIFATSR